ncbi:MAG: hypothetical protein WA705_15620 [Candidatus Ozemobacteraceae bacterium]
MIRAKVFPLFFLSFVFFAVTVFAAPRAPLCIPSFSADEFPLGLHNSIAEGLILPSTDRTPTQIVITGPDTVQLMNIIHENQLWEANVDLNSLESAEIINAPILRGVFHFAMGFHFKGDGLVIENKAGQTQKHKIIIMGTGPEKAFSITGMAGMQILQMRTQSFQDFLRTSGKTSFASVPVRPFAGLLVNYAERQETENTIQIQ